MAALAGAAFNQIDANGNGTITRSECMAEVDRVQYAEPAVASQEPPVQQQVTYSAPPMPIYGAQGTPQGSVEYAAQQQRHHQFQEQQQQHQQQQTCTPPEGSVAAAFAAQGGTVTYVGAAGHYIPAPAPAPTMQYAMATPLSVAGSAAAAGSTVAASSITAAGSIVAVGSVPAASSAAPAPAMEHAAPPMAEAYAMPAPPAVQHTASVAEAAQYGMVVPAQQVDAATAQCAAAAPAMEYQQAAVTMYGMMQEGAAPPADSSAQYGAPQQQIYRAQEGAESTAEAFFAMQTYGSPPMANGVNYTGQPTMAYAQPAQFQQAPEGLPAARSMIVYTSMDGQVDNSTPTAQKITKAKKKQKSNACC
eukprot:NODE_10482_length_1348_cov_3.604423.p1 GENE.NODE_10482_length_1348_cov_3.604423~~NODE_10482_length_1348_cov_3.604423.p1  ORF type:complete len:385 (+),score=114.26 NODE_10482_length_1348_cov_3.604423:72-1157(+)